MHGILMMKSPPFSTCRFAALGHIFTTLPVICMQAYNLPEEHAAAYLKTKSVNHIVGKMKEKDQLEEHPDVKAFLDWKDKLKVSPP